MKAARKMGGGGTSVKHVGKTKSNADKGTCVSFFTGKCVLLPQCFACCFSSLD